MKHLFFAVLIFIFHTATPVSAQETTQDAVPDIRYRSIVYFYPDTVPPTDTDLISYMPNFTRVDELPENTDAPVVSFRLLSDFSEYYPVPPHDYLGRFGRGITKDQADAIQDAKQILLMDVAYPHTMFLTGQAPVAGFLHDIATTYDGLIWDSETRELFEPRYWKDKRLSPWTDEFPNIVDHITIHAYQNDAEGIRAITLGMSKFGLPDVVVNNFSWSLGEPMGYLVNLTAQSLLEGVTPKENDTLRLDINQLHDTKLKQSLLASMKDNAASMIDIGYGEAKREDGDPDNILLELIFDGGEGESLSEKQDNILSTLFGWEDSVTAVQHDAELLAASDRAKTKLDDLRKDFNDGLEPGGCISLKAPFKTDEGGNEWMWVEVISWDKTAIKGMLKNEPFFIYGLSAGAMVDINQEDVFDYIRTFANGTSEGNETGKIMQDRQD